MSQSNPATRYGLYGILVVYTVISLLPPLWMLMVSFKKPEDVFNMPPHAFSGWTLNNYAQVYIAGNYGKFLLNSVIIVLVTVLATLILGTAAGYALSRFEITGREDMQFFALTTRMGPPIAFALPFYVLFRSLNMIDTHAAMVIVYILFNLAFAIWMMKGFFDEVPKKFEEAAQLDGYSKLGAFRRVSLPLAKSGIVATAIFVFIFTWNEFFYGLILTSTVAKPYTVQLTAFQGPNRLLWGQLFAAATVPIIPPIVFAVLVRKKLARGLTFGAVK